MTFPTSAKTVRPTTSRFRPTLLLAVAHEKAKAEQKEQLAQVWRRQLPEGVAFEQIEQWYHDLKAVKRAEICSSPTRNSPSARSPISRTPT